MPLPRILLLSVLLAVAATAALGAAPASAVTVNCGLKRHSFVFWPKGNRAQALPHMDFYTYTRSTLLARIDREGGGSFDSRCKRMFRTPAFHSVTRPTRTRTARALRCRFPNEATIAIHPISDEDEELGIHVLVRRRTVMFAQLFDDKPPILTYDRGFCSRARLPG
jgi:hypothetical protein